MEFIPPLLLKNRESIGWILRDDEKSFQRNLEKYPDSIHFQNYEKNPITYELNNYGFRTPDDFFEGDEGTVYLGCSNTFGIAHHLQNVWSYKLHKKIGKGKFFNISYGSTGLVHQYYFLKYFSDKLKINKVFHYYPIECHYRYGFLDKDANIKIIGHFAQDWKNELDEELWKEYLIHEPYNTFHNHLYKDAISNICKEIGCEYIRYESTKKPARNAYHTKLTPARDLLHYYVEGQHEVYEKFFELSKEKTSLI